MRTSGSRCIGKMLLFRKNLAVKGKCARIRGCSEKLYRLFQTIKSVPGTIKLDKLIDVKP